MSKKRSGKIRRRDFKTYDEYFMAVWRKAIKHAGRISRLAFNAKKRRVRKKNWARIGR